MSLCDEHSSLGPRDIIRRKCKLYFQVGYIFILADFIGSCLGSPQRPDHTLEHASCVRSLLFYSFFKSWCEKHQLFTYSVKALWRYWHVFLIVPTAGSFLKAIQKKKKAIQTFGFVSFPPNKLTCFLYQMKAVDFVLSLDYQEDQSQTSVY